jgi:hypothetical protein
MELVYENYTPLWFTQRHMAFKILIFIQTLFIFQQYQ